MSKKIFNQIDLYYVFTQRKTNDYLVVEDKIISSDSEDGGADHDVVIKDITTGKYYEACYTDWDIDNFEFDEETDEVWRCDFDNELHEVEPIQVTVTKYKRVK